MKEYICTIDEEIYVCEEIKMMGKIDIQPEQVFCPQPMYIIGMEVPILCLVLVVRKKQKTIF